MRVCYILTAAYLDTTAFGAAFYTGCMSKPTVLPTDYIHVDTTDLARSTAFYELLGFRRTQEYRNSHVDARPSEWLIGSDYILRLWPQDETADLSVMWLRLWADQPTIRLPHLTVTVPSLAKVKEVLERHSYPVLYIEQDDDHSGHTPFYTKDPDGMLISLSEKPEKK